jgi:DGQHR domain-containing protein
MKDEAVPSKTLQLRSSDDIAARQSERFVYEMFNEERPVELIPIPVVRHSQKGLTCYVGHMPAWMAREVTFADSFPADEANGRLGYQRQPNHKRAKAFADYLAHTDSGFMTPILLNSRQPLDFRSADGSSTGEIVVAKGQRFAKIDGQHRGLGIEEYLDDDDYAVPFMMFDQLDSDLEQQLFVAINREQKRVSMSHVLYVESEGDELTSIAQRLNDDDRSPWHRKVNLIGSTGTGLSVTLQGLRDGLEYLFAAGRTKVLPEDNKYVIAREFWSAVADTWPGAWALPKKHLITTAVGILGLSKSGSFIVVDCLTGEADPEDSIDRQHLRELLGKARSVDWRRGDGQFAGLGGRGGADRVADALDGYVFGGPIT